MDVIDLVAAWLPDLTPLAAVARFSRCSSHYRSYLVGSRPNACYECSLCLGAIECVVEGHEHFSRNGSAFILYRGRELGAGYVWEPSSDLLLCLSCFESFGFEGFSPELTWFWWPSLEIEDERDE